MRTLVIVAFISLSFQGIAQFGHYTFGGDGNDYFQSILPNNDSTFYLVGTKSGERGQVWLMKINTDCEIAWEKVYGDSLAHQHGHRLISLANGNLLIVGERRLDESGTALAMAIDTSGQLLWQLTYSGIQTLQDVAENNGGLLFLGGNRTDHSKRNAVLIQTDSVGNEIWRKESHILDETFPKRLLTVTGGEFIIAGRANGRGGDWNIFLQRITTQGDEIWTRIWRTDYRETDPSIDDFYIEPLGVTRAADGSIWITNPTWAGGGILLFQFSEHGELLRERKYYQNGTERIYPYGLLNTQDGQFLITGRTDLPGLAALLNQQGKEIWQKTYQNEGITRYFEAAVVQDGYLLVGMSTKNQTLPDLFDGLITKIRHDGSFLPWKVTGQLLYDKENQCNPAHEAIPASGWFVKVRQTSMIQDPTEQIFITDNTGRFEFYTHTVFSNFTVLNPKTDIWHVCNDDQTIYSSSNNPIDSVRLFIRQIDTCAYLEVSLTQADLMRCDTSCTIIVVRNAGLRSTEAQRLKLELERGLTLISCSEPFIMTGDFFEIELPPLDGISEKVIHCCVRLSCDVQLGATHGMRVSLIPAQCGTQYQGPLYSVDGQCVSDEMRFTLHNVGGDAAAQASYRIYTDHLLIHEAPLDLMTAGSMHTITYPADGRTRRVEIDQDMGYPGVKITQAEIEGCGTLRNGLHSIGYRNMHAFSIGDPNMSEVYMPNTTGVPNIITECQTGVGIYNIIDDVDYLEFSARVSNPLNVEVNTIEFAFFLTANFNPTTFEIIASAVPADLQYQENRISVTLRNLSVPPGGSTALRFRIKPHTWIPYDDFSQSLLSISGIAYFDLYGPVHLASGFLRYSKNFPIVADESIDYPDNFLLYGGKYNDFSVDIVEGVDNSLLLIGNSYSYSDGTQTDGLIIKTDVKGIAQWLNAFDVDRKNNLFAGGVPLEDGGCLTAGTIHVRSAHTTATISRFSDQGETYWQLQVHPCDPQSSATVNGIVPTTDNHYIVYGCCQNPDGLDQFYAKIDAQGDVVWTKHEEISGSAFEPGFAFTLPNGEVVFLGRNKSTALNFDLYLEKIDSEGSRLWSSGYNSPNGIYPAGLAVTEDGNILVAGTSQWEPELNKFVYGPTIVVFDENGDFIWEENIFLGLESDAFIHDIIETSDHTFLLTGSIYVGSILDQDVLLMHIDANADTLWTRHFGTLNDEQGIRLAIPGDGKIAIWGNADQRPPFFDAHTFLLITDDDGQPLHTPFPERKSELQALIFPNPASDRVNIVLNPESMHSTKWQLYSIDGRLITAGSFSPSALMSIDVNKMESGTYFITFPGALYAPQKLMIIK